MTRTVAACSLACLLGCGSGSSVTIGSTSPGADGGGQGVGASGNAATTGAGASTGTGASAGTGSGAGAAASGGIGGGETTACQPAPGVDLCDGQCGKCPHPTEDICTVAYGPTGNLETGVCSEGDFFQHYGFCNVCEEGDACIVTYTGGPVALFCVDRAVCVAKVDMGEKGCVFPDKSLFTLDAIPDPTTCPPGPPGVFCGGACGVCSSGNTCHGRSPTHPVGLCAVFVGLGQPVPSDTQPCSVGAPCSEATQDCFIYADDLHDTQTYAIQSGICFPAAVCKSIAENLPGGGACFDVEGKMVVGSVPQ